MKYSDIIIPRGVENDIAISFVTENLKNQLKVRAGFKSTGMVLFDKLPFATNVNLG
jgi:hypothetical protein